MPETITTPRRSVDDRGRAILLTDAEARAQAERSLRALDEAAAIGDEEEQRQTLESLRQAHDEDRLSERERFRRCD